MPTFKDLIVVTTDASGHYSTRQKVNPPGPTFLGFNIEVKARLLSPTGITVKGSLDIDAADGNPQNPAKDFILSSEQISLGKWKLDGGDNDIVVSGQTEPAVSNTEIQIEIEAVL